MSEYKIWLEPFCDACEPGSQHFVYDTPGLAADCPVPKCGAKPKAYLLATPMREAADDLYEALKELVPLLAEYVPESDLEGARAALLEAAGKEG